MPGKLSKTSAMKALWRWRYKSVGTPSTERTTGTTEYFLEIVGITKLHLFPLEMQ